MYIGPKFLVDLSFCSTAVNNFWFFFYYISLSINMKKLSVSFLTKCLRTPNMQPLCSLSILFNYRTNRYAYFNHCFFFILFHSFLYFTLWYLIIIQWRIIITWMWSRIPLPVQIFRNISFIWLYKLSGIYLLFIDFIGCKKPLSHEHSLLSIRNCMFSYLLLCPHSKCSNRSIESYF